MVLLVVIGIFMSIIGYSGARDLRAMREYLHEDWLEDIKRQIREIKG